MDVTNIVWPQQIERAETLLDRIARADLRGIWPARQRRPEPATESQLLRVEDAEGHPLDPAYRSFLAAADGMPAFYQAVDLFGTHQLLGAAPMAAVQERLDANTDGDFAAAVGMPRRDLLAIAGSALQGDIFFLARPWARWPGTVIWYDSAVFERFPDFHAFFVAMMTFNARELATLVAEGRADQAR